jgi:hypothetical protein
MQPAEIHLLEAGAACILIAAFLLAWIEDQRTKRSPTHPWLAPPPD